MNPLSPTLVQRSGRDEHKRQTIGYSFPLEKKNNRIEERRRAKKPRVGREQVVSMTT